MMLQGIYRYTSRYNIEISIYTTDSSQQKRKSYRQFCRERNISGAILSGITTTDPYFEELVQSDLPCVLIDIPMVGEKVGSVSIDNIAASREMVERLIALDHQQLTVIAGKRDTSVTLERLAGIRQGLQAYGLELACFNRKGEVKSSCTRKASANGLHRSLSTFFSLPFPSAASIRSF